jgi:hypothetical protein
MYGSWDTDVKLSGQENTETSGVGLENCFDW